jgi:hypothetical protein
LYLSIFPEDHIIFSNWASTPFHYLNGNNKQNGSS